MFFRKKKEIEASKEEAREAMKNFLHDIFYEVEAQRQMATKSELFTNEEFVQFMEDTLNEASEVYDDMTPREILDERIKSKMDKVVNADNVKVIKVEL